MPGWRPERIGEMIHREVSSRLMMDIKDPELSPISVTRVEVTKDLGRAVIWFLPLGGGAVSKSLKEALGRAARAMRGPIGNALRLRVAPELVFKFDEAHEEAVRITDMLNRIGRELAQRDREAKGEAAAGEE
jgi:ribosome-binding factor A